MKRKIAFLLMLALMLAPIYASQQVQASEVDVADGGAVIKPLAQVFTYKADSFELNVTVPSYINTSTPDDKKSAALDIYLKKIEALSGFFSIDVEAGVMISFPIFAVYLFVDIDVTILGIWMPDAFQFKWPIYGIPTDTISLESGDVGVYALVVPVNVAEGELETLPTGEWSHIGSYDLYVVEEQKFVALGIPAENITIGEVASIEPILGPALVAKGFGYYSYSNNLTSIVIRSVSEQLYPNDALTLETRIEAKTDVYFHHLTLNVYGVRKVGGEYTSALVGSLAILNDIRLASGVVRTEDLTLTIPNDTLPGLLYGIVSAKFLPLYILLSEPVHLYDDFIIVYIGNEAYNDLLNDYNSLSADYISLNSTYYDLLDTYNQLQSDYNSLNSTYNDLKSKYDVLTADLGSTRNLNYLFIVTTIIFIATTVYVAVRKPKVKPELKAT